MLVMMKIVFWLLKINELLSLSGACEPVSILMSFLFATMSFSSRNTNYSDTTDMFLQLEFEKIVVFGK